MKKTRTVSLEATIVRGEGPTETEIEIEVTGELVPYHAGSWEEPPEGGGVEDVRATHQIEHPIHSKHRRLTVDVELTEDEEREFAGQLAENAIDDAEDDPPEYEPPDDYGREEAYDD